jgi:hypothetical protein
MPAGPEPKAHKHDFRCNHDDDEWEGDDPDTVRTALLDRTRAARVFHAASLFAGGRGFCDHEGEELEQLDRRQRERHWEPDEVIGTDSLLEQNTASLSEK